MRYYMLKHIEIGGELLGICLAMSDHELSERVYGPHEVVELTGQVLASPGGDLYFIDEDLFEMCYGKIIKDTVKYLFSINTFYWSRAGNKVRHSRWKRIGKK